MIAAFFVTLYNLTNLYSSSDGESLGCGRYWNRLSTRQCLKKQPAPRTHTHTQGAPNREGGAGDRERDADNDIHTHIMFI